MRARPGLQESFSRHETGQRGFKARAVRFLRSDIGIALLLLLLAAALRMPFLDYPHAVVFDETHMGKYLAGYFTSTYVFDVHPPLSRFLYALVAGAAGFRPGFDFAFEAAYPAGVPIALLRLLPALLGSLLVPVLYLLARELSLSRRAALLVGAFALFENMLIVFSRFMLLDGILLFLLFLGLLLAFRARRLAGRQRIALVLVAGAVLGLALATKWTAAAALVFVVFVELFWHGLPRRADMVRAGGLLAAAAVAYLTVFAFQLPWLAGAGPVEQIVRANQEMLTGHWRIPGGNGYASAWHTWPALARPIYAWTDNAGSKIYVQGNPAVWWLSFAAVLIALSALSPLARTMPRAQKKMLLALLALYALSFLPFALVQRDTFIHAYLPALLASTLILGALFDRLPRDRASALLYAGALVAALALFLFFAPLTYGSALSEAEFSAHLWLPTWL